MIFIRNKGVDAYVFTQLIYCLQIGYKNAVHQTKSINCRLPVFLLWQTIKLGWRTHRHRCRYDLFRSCDVAADQRRLQATDRHPDALGAGGAAAAFVPIREDCCQ